MKNKIVSFSKKMLSIILSFLILFSVGSAVSPVVAQAVTSSSSKWHSLHRFTVNKADAFCINFSKRADNVQTFKTDKAAKNYWNSLGASKQQKINDALTAANNLGYLNSKSNAKYFAVQRYIWTITDGQKVEKSTYNNIKKFRKETQTYYDKLKKEIKDNKSSYSKKPNISKVTLKPEKNYVAKTSDKNKVLSDWKIKSTGSLNVGISGDSLTIDGSDTGNFDKTKTIVLQRKKPTFKITSNEVGKFNDQEAIMTAGSYSYDTYKFSVDSDEPEVVHDYAKGSIKIKKVDENGMPMKGVSFNVKYNDKEGVSQTLTIVTDANGIAQTSTDYSENGPALDVYKDADNKDLGKISYTVIESEYNDNVYFPYSRIEAVSGITLEKDKEVLVGNSDDGKTWINIEKRGDAKVIKKVEQKDGSYELGKGFKFYLKGVADSGETVSYESTTNDEGVAYFCNVPVGSYKLTEEDSNIYLPIESQDVQIVWDKQYKAEKFSTDASEYQDDEVFKAITEEDNDATEETQVDLEDAVADENTDSEEATETTNDIEDTSTDDTTTNTAEYVSANTYLIKNKYRRGDLKLVKTEEYVEENTPLDIKTRNGEGFEFVVSSNAANNVTGTDLSYTVTTDEDGIAYLNDIPAGTYEIEEKTQSPEFKKFETKTVTVVYDESSGYSIKGFEKINTDSSTFNSTNGKTLSLVNEYVTGTIRCLKTDPDGEPLSDVTFGLYLANDDGKMKFTMDNALKSGKTDENGVLEFKNIPYGDYYIVELSAKEGYVLISEPLAVSIREDGKVVEVAVENELITGEIQITKTDVSTGKVIPNCKIEILDADKNVVVQGTTDENGIVKFTLTYGKYYYREYEAPEGYILDTTPFPFTISENGKTIKAIMTNEAIPDNPKPKKPETPEKITKTGDSTLWVIMGGSLLIIAGAVFLSIYSRKKEDPAE